MDAESFALVGGDKEAILVDAGMLIGPCTIGVICFAVRSFMWREQASLSQHELHILSIQASGIFFTFAQHAQMLFTLVRSKVPLMPLHKLVFGNNNRLNDLSALTSPTWKQIPSFVDWF